MAEYKEHKKPIEADSVFAEMEKKTDIDFSAEILTSGHWPNQESATIKIPGQLGSL